MIRIENLSEIYNWHNTGLITPYIEQNWCSNRAEFNGRLASYFKILQNQFSEDCSYLVLSSLGEIGNNCFDHNLGYWQGPPGCLFIRQNKYALIADRGQGIKSSLSRVIDFSKETTSALEIAYSRVVTGRAPERRGNGLKFVKKNINQCKVSLAVASDSETISFGPANTDIQINNLKKPGVFSLMSW